MQRISTQRRHSCGNNVESVETGSSLPYRSSTCTYVITALRKGAGEGWWTKALTFIVRPFLNVMHSLSIFVFLFSFFLFCASSHVKCRYISLPSNMCTCVSRINWTVYSTAPYLISCLIKDLSEVNFLVAESKYEAFFFLNSAKGFWFIIKIVKK